MHQKCLSRLVVSLASFAVWLCASQAFAAKMNIEGSLPRNYDTGYFDITVTISRVDESERDAGVSDSSADRFTISIGSDNRTILFDNEPNFNADGNRYYISVRDALGPETDDEVATQFKYVYELRIHDLANGANLEEDATNNQLGIIVDFHLGGRETEPVITNDGNPKIITRDLYVVTQAPEFEAVGIRGVYESLIIDFMQETTVSHSDGEQRAPNSVKAVAVDTGVITGDRTFPAYLFSDDEDQEDTATTCDFTFANINGAACITCDDNVYLDTAAMDNIAGVSVATGSIADGSATISGLQNRGENDPVYAVFMQYEPSGIDQSSCLIGRPTEDITMTELNGAGEAEILDIRCFIASAAYGSALHSDVNLFRAFRDRVLLKFTLGEWFVHRYYEYSPPLAAMIEDSPVAQFTARWLLAIPAMVLDIFYDDDEQRP